MENPPSKHCAAAAQRVLRAAAELFSVHGYDAVSMSAIAEQAQVSKANIFHHFKSKNALYYEVLRSACADAAQVLDAIEQVSGDVRERLLHYARARLCGYLDHPQATRMVLRELTHERSEPEARLVREDFGRSFARLVALIRSGQDAGKLRTDVNPAALALLVNAGNILYAQLRPALTRFADVDFAEDPERFSALMMDILLRGAAASPG